MCKSVRFSLLGLSRATARSQAEAASHPGSCHAQLSEGPQGPTGPVSSPCATRQLHLLLHGHSSSDTVGAHEVIVLCNCKLGLSLLFNAYSRCVHAGHAQKHRQRFRLHTCHRQCQPLSESEVPPWLHAIFILLNTLSAKRPSRMPRIPGQAQLAELQTARATLGPHSDHCHSQSVESQKARATSSRPSRQSVSSPVSLLTKQHTTGHQTSGVARNSLSRLLSPSCMSCLASRSRGQMTCGPAARNSLSRLWSPLCMSSLSRSSRLAGPDHSWACARMPHRLGCCCRHSGADWPAGPADWQGQLTCGPPHTCPAHTAPQSRLGPGSSAPARHSPHSAEPCLRSTPSLVHWCLLGGQWQRPSLSHAPSGVILSDTLHGPAAKLAMPLLKPVLGCLITALVEHHCKHFVLPSLAHWPKTYCQAL